MRALFRPLWWLILSLWLLSGPAAAAERLLVLGDSLTAHHGLPETQGWVALLQQQLDEEGRAIELINAGISGDTTAGGLSRLPALLEAHRPNWVMIELGANDGLRGLPPTEIKRNLLDMINLVRTAGARPLLAGMQLPLNYGSYYRTRFAAVFVETAEATDTPLLPFLLEGVGGMAELNLPDGIHPNAAGQQRVRDTVGRFLHSIFAW